MSILPVLYLFTLLLGSATTNEENEIVTKKDIFSAIEKGFLLNGQKFRVYAGEIHYFRIAECGWEDRLKKLQKTGLNTVSTAVEWAMHEPEPDVYNWRGSANFTRFVELAQNLNLFVIIRAGPYIGVDRNLGGLPEWLLTRNDLKDHQSIHRSGIEYRNYAETWLSHFLPKLSKMMITNGGPVIMVQIDSDLGESTPCATTEWLHEIYKTYLGDNAVLFTMDNNNDNNFKCGKIQGTISAFRTNPWEYIKNFNQSMNKLFSKVKRISPDSPKLVELRTGMPWHWQSQRFSFETENFIVALKDLIDYDSSIIIYMFAGGTNFERAGQGNYDSMGMTTSYDFDAIISESGDLTEKYDELKSIIPNKNLVGNYEDMSEEFESAHVLYDLHGKLTFSYFGSLLDQEVRREFGISGIRSKYPLPFNQIGVSNALVVYKTIIPEKFKDMEEVYLECKNVHDRGYVYVYDSLTGLLDKARHFSLKILPIPGQSIQILVENQGYMSQSVIGEPKGILSNVTLDDTTLTNWTMYALPLDNVNNLQRKVKSMKPRKLKIYGNSILLARFKTPKDINHAVDAYLNTKSTKGQVFLNDRSMGKYWSVGPQKELYLPGCYFNPDPMENQMLIIEVEPQGAYFDEEKNTFVARSARSKASKYGVHNLVLNAILYYVSIVCNFRHTFLCFQLMQSGHEWVAK